MSAGQLTQGTRLPDAEFGTPGPGWDAWQNGSCAAGSYMKVAHDKHGCGSKPWWFIVDPRGDVGRIETHTVTEHEDGSVTVSPSIAPYEAGGWHGYLEHGVWREC